ncbi:hypothetical protein GCM10007971_29350 [Oceanobacillus indicireducens]|uniref:Uncharacterized protein n=1 Tax=Oceanobacillus indicireducens TaxID=1004261 RepID=A0A917Y2T2_9BACI|nr:hypothetical protein GCM10007971_29350 [Oceanobacillus indicireducens]
MSQPHVFYLSHIFKVYPQNIGPNLAPKVVSNWLINLHYLAFLFFIFLVILFNVVVLGFQ